MHIQRRRRHSTLTPASAVAAVAAAAATAAFEYSFVPVRRMRDHVMRKKDRASASIFTRCHFNGPITRKSEYLRRR